MKGLKNGLKLRIFFITVFVLAAMLSGCSETDDILSEEEIDAFNTEFFNGRAGNMNNMLLSSEYAKPENIDLFQLFYNGIYGETVIVSEDEVSLLTELSSEAPHLDIMKVTSDKMNDFIQENLGLRLEETEKIGLDCFYYLESYDSYYLIVGDTNYVQYNIISGIWESDDKLILKYTKDDEPWTVTLQKQGNDFLFVSNIKEK